MSEREQFEAWLLRRQGPTGDTPGYPGSVPFFHDQEAAAWEGWQAARAQPAQAVPASCGECGKKASDGWALYCVACMEKAGLPAVTDSPPLMHSCTSSLGKTPDSTAQAWQVLSDAEIDDAYEKARADYQRSRFAVRGQQLTAQDSPDWWFARAVEAAVLAKRVPMTEAQINAALSGNPRLDNEESFALGVRAAEQFHGIVGKEGA